MAVRIGLLSPVTPTTAEDVRAAWADSPPMRLPQAALPLLDEWATSLRRPGPHTEGPGRSPAEASPLIAYLRKAACEGLPIAMTALHRERHGGRLYPLALLDYAGPVSISDRQLARHHPRLLLSAIRRDVRALLTGPDGQGLLDVDLTACHAAIAVALSHDPQLQDDLRGSLYQRAGDRWGSRLADPGARRGLGKRLVLALLMGGGPAAVQEVAGLHGLAPTREVAAAVAAAWWDRYPRLRAQRDGLARAVHRAAEATAALELVSPTGWVSRWSPAEVRGYRAGQPARTLDEVVRSVWSAAFRAVEASILDRAVRYMTALGVQPVLPVYDGLLVLDGPGVATAARTAALAAAAELGVHLDVHVTPLLAENRTDTLRPAERSEAGPRMNACDGA